MKKQIIKLLPKTGYAAYYPQHGATSASGKFFWLLLLALVFHLPMLSAASDQLSVGKLPIPGSSNTSDYLTLAQHGTILENDQLSLEWKSDGNLMLYYYGVELVWQSNTANKGTVLAFQSSDGKLTIKDSGGKTLWSSTSSGGSLLKLQSDKNLVMLNTSGQKIWETATAIPQLSTGGTINWQGPVRDYAVPYGTSGQYLYLQLEGADGGNRDYKPGFYRVQVGGGEGATISAIFAIGELTGQIPPGSTVRVLLGARGETRTVGTTAGCGGGDGSGVFFQRPDNGHWYMLMVAGGGGGAYADCCSVRREGRPAEIGENGGAGGGRDGIGGAGTNGECGAAKYGTFSISGCGVQDLTYINPVGEEYNGEIQPNPRALPQPYDIEYPGCGSGGDGYIGGGGGGGYSGGGGGLDYYPGGGGGSYINTDFALEYTRRQNGHTTNPGNAYLKYEILAVPHLYKMIRLAENEDKCIDLDHSNTSNGTNIQLWDCNDTEAQEWIIDNAYLKLSKATNKCLSLEDANASEGSNVHLWDCKEATHQEWIYDVLRNIVRSAKDFDKCLDLVDNNTASGTNIRIADCTPNVNQPGQQWIMDGVPSSMPTGNNRRIHLENDNGKCVDIAGAGTANGTNVQLYQCNDTDSQYLVFDNRYIRMQANTDKCLSIKEGFYPPDANSTNIHLWDCKGKDNQKWVYDGFAKAFRSVAYINKCLSIKDSDARDGSNIHLWDCNNNGNQRFDLY